MLIMFLRYVFLTFVSALVGMMPQSADAVDLRLAVSSNFVATMKMLGERFSDQTGHSLVVSSASTGKHFAQIKQGAPYDLFLAADRMRPEFIEQHGYGVKETRFTYAVGKLVLWSAVARHVESDILNTDSYRWLALANPRHAPYGLAAKQTLQSLGLWSALQDKLLRAENVNQALQFVATENAQLGFASLAQIQQLKEKGVFKGSYWVVPSRLHSPLEQQIVLLKESPAAREFLDFLKSDPVRKIIRDQGYDTL